MGLELVNQNLIAWASRIVGEGVQVGNEILPEGSKELSVTFFLTALLPATPSHGNQSAPLQVILKYLVFISGSNTSQAHELLENLLFAAMENNKFVDKQEFELELNPPDPEVWSSLRISVRPSFWLQVVHMKQRDIKPIQRVTEAISVNVFPKAVFSGMVVSPKGLPIVGARVELPANNVSTKTNSTGHFRFSAVSPNLKKTKLIVTYKQYSYESNVSVSSSPIEIVFNLKEF